MQGLARVPSYLLLRGALAVEGGAAADTVRRNVGEARGATTGLPATPRAEALPLAGLQAAPPPPGEADDAGLAPPPPLRREGDGATLPLPRYIMLSSAARKGGGRGELAPPLSLVLEPVGPGPGSSLPLPVMTVTTRALTARSKKPTPAALRKAAGCSPLTARESALSASLSTVGSAGAGGDLMGLVFACKACDSNSAVSAQGAADDGAPRTRSGLAVLVLRRGALAGLWGDEEPSNRYTKL